MTTPLRRPVPPTPRTTARPSPGRQTSAPQVPRRTWTTPFALAAASVLLLSACSPHAAAPEPTGPVPGLPRNSPLHAADPADVARARALPTTYPSSAPGTGKPTATVTVPRTPAGATTFQQGAVGLSFESTDLSDPRLSEDTADLVSILDALHGPTLRFGGNSTDRRMFFTSEDEPTPTDWPLNEGEAITRVTPSDLERVAALARRTDSSVVVSVNLARYDPERAADFAAHARDAFGDNLVGVMIGNEPNGYHQGRGNPLTVKGPGWNPTVYAQQLTAYARAVHREAPDLPVVAPGAYSADWWNAAAGAKSTDPLALAVHQYPLSECGSRWPRQRPTVANAVDPATRERVDTLLDDAHDDAAARDVPLWVTETSLSACSGSNEITETLVGAVHQAEYSMRAQAAGAQRVAVHSSLAPCEGGPPMSPVCSDGTPANPGQRFGVRANGLALALVASIPDGRVQEVRTGTENLTVFAVDHGDGTTSLLLTDYRDPRDAPPRSTTVKLPAPVSTVSQAQLNAESWRSCYPVDSLFTHHTQRQTPTPRGTPAPAAASHTAYPADPSVALSVEEALQPVDPGAASVDGYGLPIAPPSSRPRVSGVEPGRHAFTVSLPAGSATVLTIDTQQPTARPSSPAHPANSGTPGPVGTPGTTPRATTRSGGQ
ncbi:hypothetical protein QWJ06_02400 [Kocuria rhizophila]|uniref:hypothetical protein n=1 Tax=Kocuria rhizophila TaxID=72000 RepID=UPI0025B0CE1F|nr:hypothetical protein [Kocuria rhizophila]MDN3225574.1 hypothetical protein [Kocuria rhizophila]